VDLRRLFADRALLVLLFAGFSSGMPLWLVGKCLQAWMTQAGIDAATIGYVAWLSLPWSFKFLLAPIVDRVVPTGGRRRGWLLLTVTCLMAAIAAMSWQQPLTGRTLLLLNAVVIALCAATQDVVIDAYRVESLRPEQFGLGAASAVLGYRLALLVTGGIGFSLAASLTWPTVYLLMAGAQAVGLVAWVLMREPVSTPPTTWQAAILDPLREYHARRGLRLMLAIGGFVLLFKLADAVAFNLATTFLLQAGYSLAQIGLVSNTYGVAATIVGVGIGGLALPWLGLNRSLWIFGISQGASNLAYAWLAAHGGGLPELMVVMTIENLCAGLGTASFVAFLSGECVPVFAASQYALLSSVMALGSNGLGGFAGTLKQALHLDWSEFFLLATCLALPGLLLLPLVAPWRKRSDFA
jgi:MFS transporter, PAT family, beta-lactamase induction signal transducer AmpG